MRIPNPVRYALCGFTVFMLLGYPCVPALAEEDMDAVFIQDETALQDEGLLDVEAWDEAPKFDEDRDFEEIEALVPDENATDGLVAPDEDAASVVDVVPDGDAVPNVDVVSDTDTVPDVDMDETVFETEGSEETPHITKNGWNQSEGGAWYWSDDGKTAVSGWKSVKGAWYFFDRASFAMKVAEAFEDSGKTYVAMPDGVCPVSSWVELVAGWYLTDASCAARSGWARSGNSWYYLDPETNVMKSGEVFSDGGKTYVAKDSGVCPTNEWVRLDGRWYRTKSDCSLAAGWAKVSGSWYFLDRKTYAMKESELFSDGKADYVAKPSGACPSSSWVSLGGRWYRTKGDCSLVAGWTKSGGSWYFLDRETHAMKAGEVFGDGGKSYVAKASGVCPSSAWVKIGGDWFLTDGSSAVRTGWAHFGSTNYYLAPSAEVDANGKMVTGFAEVDGALYHFSKSGVMTTNTWLKLDDGSVGYAGMTGEVTSVEGVTLDGGKVNLTGKVGWNELGNDKYYVAKDGSLLTGWQLLGNTWYWFDPSTYMMARGIQTIDGHAYVFTDVGAWLDITGDTQLNYKIATIMRDKTGLDLRACYDYVRTAYSYKSMGTWPSYSGWQRDYARTIVTTGSGNCYAFASIFQYLAKACGYSSKVVQGWALNHRDASRRSAHGWVEVYIDGKTYVVDPQASNEWGMSTLYLFTYSETPKMNLVDYAYSDGVRLK